MESAFEQDTHPLTIRLPPELHASLKQRARRDERSIAAVLRIAAREYLANDLPVEEEQEQAIEHDADPQPAVPNLGASVKEALRRWHHSVGYGCRASNDGQPCCVDTLLGDVSPREVAGYGQN